MSAPSVLYDAPGPKARGRNVGYTAAFALALLAVAWVVYLKFDEKGQLDWTLWQPLLADGRTWTEFLLPGLLNTLIAGALAIVIALPVGAIFGIARLSDHAWIRTVAGTVVEFFRAIPVLILMIFANEFYFLFTDVPADSRPLYAVVTGLVLYNASVLAEVVRSGILSLPKGQSEAAMALGLRKTQTMLTILLPQAVTAMLPAIVSQLVVVLKDTALGGAILGYEDLLIQYRVISANFANTIPTLIVIAIIYIVVNFALTQLAVWLERWLRSRRRGALTGPDPDMLEEQAPGLDLSDTRKGQPVSA
ncbi:glutamate ABC transporter permease [Longimycelium tulufanense]|uniref:Glutamate ABC transporter permease n=1 Tax=Longimycelium tulufanense TaxID=907463 RepID=A0A8J3CGE5_9PSEU|nr:amino acid ABC transporter permease [Longimycelium tulufanense]GGM61940.1 glutamate ABC transporter permease [Longimycelium tulufanense]